MTFLGLLIDTLNGFIAIPTDKVAKACNMIGKNLASCLKPSSKRKITILQLEQICGFLNFLGRAVIPRCAFTCRLYSKLTGLSHLKPYNHLKVTEEMLLDLEMWEKFWKHQSAFCREFLDFDN